MQALKGIVRAAILRTDSRLTRYWLPYHDYLVHTTELCLLCRYLEQTHGLPGPVLEIGCERGKTTVFLNKHLDAIDDRRKYVCVDTFGGFTRQDIEHEVSVRGKRERELSPWFRAGKKELFEKTMKLNSICRVQAVQADINEWDLGALRDISFCFIDVDLYRPVRSALTKVHGRMAPGGIIAVHDCGPKGAIFDGARDAYEEFTREHGYPEATAFRIGEVRVPLRAQRDGDESLPRVDQ